MKKKCPYLVFVFTAATRSSTELHVVLLIHHTTSFIGSIVCSDPSCSNIFSKFLCLCRTTVYQSFNYQMLQWGPSIWKIPVPSQFGRTVDNGGIKFLAVFSFKEQLTIVARCWIMKRLFLSYEVVLMPSGFS